VEEADGLPPFDYDSDRFLLFQDVYPDPDHFIEEALMSIPMAYERAQTMVLINGKGGGITDAQQLCNSTLTIIDVKPGKTYRLRIIGGTAGSFIRFGFEDHTLEVIEADA
jgi:L-ascorbate oxidase